ncbi:MraY family glycosyltransferase [Foetidibacter luteolus]|uniref:MraY family glycosyltransferase n=1 Tax=Foetidibacter luteolus TaxID=2608880 RepID=UPI001A99C97C|nr:MraY family glycosyltransferase [Foetidibacter luteolus]
MPVIIRIAQVKKLYDTFDERKAHINPTPRLGGIPIFAGLVLSLLLSLNFGDGLMAFQYYIASFFIIFTLGVVDDIIILAAWKKMIIQLFIAVLLVMKAGLVITSLHGFIGVDDMHPLVAKGFTILTIFTIINAFNLVDGIDGLAASLGIISSALLAFFFLFNQDYAYAILGFCMAGCLLGFLVYNFPPAKIFMGDCGSLLIGLVSSIMVIHFIQTGASVKSFPVNATPAIGFSIILIPLMDALRVFILRVSKGQSPFVPDKNHFHHLLLHKGYSHKRITLTLAAMTITSGILAFFAQRYFGTTGIILSLCFLFFTTVYLIKTFIFDKPELRVIDEEIPALPYEGEVKVVSIFTPEKAAAAKKD